MILNINNNQNWKDMAKSLLQYEKSIKTMIYPEPIRAIITWKNDIYIGHIQEIVPEFSKEVVVLSKSSNPLQKELIEEIRKLDKERIELYVDDNLDLEGRQHIIRRLDNRLTYMTRQQTEYMIENPLLVNEINFKLR